MQNGRVLIGCPVHSSKLYCWDDWVASIKALKGDFDVLVVDNSPSNEIASIVPNDWMYVYTGLDLDVRDKVAFCQDFIREKAESEGYSHLLMLEQDNIPAPDTLEYLIKCNKDVVGLPYWKFEPSQKLHYMVWQEVYKKKSGELEAVLTPVMHVLDRFTGDLQPVFNIGVGCLLIRSNVLPKFKFRVVVGEEPHSDTYFAQDMWREQITIYASTLKVCKHLDTGLKVKKMTNKGKLMLKVIKSEINKNPIASKKLFLSSLEQRL